MRCHIGGSATGRKPSQLLSGEIQVEIGMCSPHPRTPAPLRMSGLSAPKGVDWEQLAWEITIG